MSQPESDLTHYILGIAEGVIGAGTLIIGWFLNRLIAQVDKHIEGANKVGGPEALKTLRGDFDAHEKLTALEHTEIRELVNKNEVNIARLEPEVGRLKKIEDSIGQLNTTMLTLSGTVGALSGTVGTLSANVASLLAHPPGKR